jgi:hypothetical protein
MTLAREPSEERLLLSSLEALSRLGLRVAVADGGSPAAFVDAVRALPGFEVVTAPERRSLLAQVRAALAHARGWNPSALLYTEPDKHGFFSQHLADFLQQAGARGEAEVREEAAEADASGGVIIAARSPAAFKTFPLTQRVAEEAGNRLCEVATGIATDYFYGPFLMAPVLADHLDALPDDVGWGWRPFVFAVAKRLGVPVSSVAGDFHCPETDREESVADRVHRMRQLSQNVEGLIRAAEYFGVPHPQISPSAPHRRVS